MAVVVGSTTTNLDFANQRFFTQGRSSDTLKTLSEIVDFTSATPGTVTDRNGYVVYGANNLLPFSQDFDNAAWVKSSMTVTPNSFMAPDGTITASTLTATGTNATLLQSFTGPADTNFDGGFILSFYAMRRTGTGTISIGIPGPFYFGQSGLLTNVWRRFTLNILGGIPNGNYGIQISTSGDEIYIWGSQIEIFPNLNTVSSSNPWSATHYFRTGSTAYYGPRINFDPTTLQSKGLLIEEQRTNLIIRNNDLSTASWTKNNISTSKVLGPDNYNDGSGSLTATRLTSSQANANVTQAITSASATRITSCYIKRNTGSGIIDLTQDGGTTWTSVNVSNSWARVNLPAVTSANPTVGLRIQTNGDSVDVWGFQHEVGNTVTSVIPTRDATVTRAPDIATITGANFNNIYNSTEGAISVQFENLANGTCPIVSIDDNTSGNNISLLTLGTDPRFLVVNNGSAQANLNGGTVASSIRYKMAAGYSSNNLAVSVSGGTPLANTTASIPFVNRIRIGSNQAGNYLNGHIANFTYYNSRLPNTIIQSITT